MTVSGGSASVQIQEIDLSTRVPGFPGVYGAIEIPARKGPIDQPYLVTYENQLLNIFTPLGKVEIGDSLAFFSAMAFLQRSNKLWVKRVIGNNYKSGGVVIRQDGRPSNMSWVTGLEDPTAFTFGTYDRFVLYQADPGNWSSDVCIKLSVARQRENVLLNSSNIVDVAATSASGVLGVGTPLITPAVSATGDLDGNILITAVPGAAGNVTVNIVGGGSAGSETAVQVGSTITVTIEDGVSTQAQICTALLALPSIQSAVPDSGSTAWTLGVGSDTVTLTGGEDQITTLSDGEITCTVLPGGEGNLIQIEIVDGAPAAGSETAVRNGDLITVRIKDGESTQSQIRTALLTVPSLFTSIVVDHGSMVWTLGVSNDSVQLSGGADAATTIKVTQRFATGEPVRFSLLTTGGGNALPGGLDNTSTFYTVASSATTVKIAASEADALAGNTIVFTSIGQGTMQIIPMKAVSEVGAFMIEVFHRRNLNVPLESFYCSLTPGAKNGIGQNMYLEDILLGSNYIRAMVNPIVTGDPLPQMTPLFMNGGNDGDPVTDGKMMQGADVFTNADTYPVTVFMDGGWATPAYQKHIDMIAQNRHDCVCLLSVPYDKEASANYINDIVDYWMNILNLSSSFSALYTPHVKVYDKFNDRALYVSPEGYAAAAVSYTAMNYEMWFPVAGFRRGQVNVLDLRRRFSKGEMDYLYDGAVSGGGGINPLRFAPGRGIMIWGQKTLLGRPSSLSRLNVRLLLCVIEPAIAKTLEDFLFELNDSATRAQVSSIISDYMNVVQARRGVYKFDVVCDDTNNPPAVIDAYQMVVDLYIQPTQAVEYIPFRVVITRTGSSLAINQAAVGGGA